MPTVGKMRDFDGIVGVMIIILECQVRDQETGLRSEGRGSI